MPIEKREQHILLCENFDNINTLYCAHSSMQWDLNLQIITVGYFNFTPFNFMTIFTAHKE